MAEEKDKKENTEARKPLKFERNDQEILEEYLRPHRQRPRFWVWVTLVASAVILVIVYKFAVLDRTITPNQLKSSIELFNLDSQWVVREKIDTKEFKGILLTPQISFRVRNIGKVNLHDIYFLGVFRLLDRAKTLGEGFEMTLKKPLKPGRESEPIALTCQFGYKASSKQAFKKNTQEWRTAMVQVFSKTGASQLIFLKNFYITRKIEGLDVDFKLTDKSAEELMGKQENQ